MFYRIIGVNRYIVPNKCEKEDKIEGASNICVLLILPFSWPQVQ